MGSELFKKAEKDPYFKDLCHALGDELTDAFLLKAGFFDDGFERVPYDLDFLSTPMDRLKGRMVEGRPGVVLLTTGGFAPIHQGHIDMMCLAKKHLEGLGYNVLGGYISPSHDSYVLNKHNKSVRLTIEERIAAIEREIADSDWLCVDPWEGRYVSRAINYTDVIERLGMYLQRHLKAAIEVVYVFGSDNAGFTWAFLKKGMCVCVRRNESRMEDVLANQRIHFVDNPGASFHLSSWEIRKNEPPKDRWNADDLPFALRFEGGLIGEAFSRALREAFLKIFTEVELLSYPVIAGRGVLSLDPFTPGEYSLGVSRLFELSGSQLKSTGLTHRPGTPPLEEQIASIPKDVPLSLLDDDIGTGQTLSSIREMLKDHQIRDVRVLLQMASNKDYYDVADCRDFLCGASLGGLVVKLPNDTIARAPYLWPYVSLKARAKIPPTKERELNVEIWGLNLAIYSKNRMKVGETDAYFRNLACYVGFGEDASMAEFCEWHLKRLA